MTAVAQQQQQQLAQKTQQQALKEKLNNDIVKQKFTEVLGKKAQGFIASVLHIATQNALLANAESNSVIQSAMIAATLDLPLNANLGFAYIIPYNVKNKKADPKEPDTWTTVAQFQMGYKGFIQLAQRSGQFKTISSAPIYEGQLVDENPLTGFLFDFKKKKSDTVIGYAAHFELLNGFSKTLYMTIDDMNKHGAKYSKTFKQQFGLWKTDFDSMANKTVLKLLLSKFAPLSIEMQTGQLADQAIVNDAETMDVSYVDNDDVADEVAQEIAENGNSETVDFTEVKEEPKSAIQPSEKFEEKATETKASEAKVPSANVVVEKVNVKPADDQSQPEMKF